MKPSEKRALEAEKRARKAAELREKELLKEARAAEKRDKKLNKAMPEMPAEEEPSRINAEATYEKLPEEQIEVEGDGYHRESFFSNHARLIAFIITAALVIFVVGPLGVDILVAKSRSEWNGSAEKNTGRNMTVSDLLTLSALGDEIEWGDLSGFSYSDSSYTKKGNTTYNYKYYLEESEDLCLEVIGSDKNEKPEIVRLIDYNSGAFIDIRDADTHQFLKEHGYL